MNLPIAISPINVIVIFLSPNDTNLRVILIQNCFVYLLASLEDKMMVMDPYDFKRHFPDLLLQWLKVDITRGHAN